MTEQCVNARGALNWTIATATGAAFIAGDLLMDLPRGLEAPVMMGWHILVGCAAAVALPRRFS